MWRPKAGSKLWNVGGFRPQRQGLRGAKRGRASGEPREAGRDTHRGAETNDRDKSWEERDQREAGRGAKQGAGNQHALQVPRNILLLRDTPVSSLGCSETSLMQAAWLLGALVVPQLLGFSHGARGAEREWEGGWGGAQEEEREREALMLKVSWRLLGL